MIDCEYCHKLYNKPLAESDNKYSSGIKISISYSKKLGKAAIEGSGYFDSFVGIEPVYTDINYCPMCGRKF